MVILELHNLIILSNDIDCYYIVQYYQILVNSI